MARPLLYQTKEELEKAIDTYFKDEKKPTITGLALHLGFESRKTFYNYEQNDEFLHTIKKARSRIENEYERKLHDPACTGAIFALKNLGWTDAIDFTSGGEPLKGFNYVIPNGATINNTKSEATRSMAKTNGQKH